MLLTTASGQTRNDALVLKAAIFTPTTYEPETFERKAAPSPYDRHGPRRLRRGHIRGHLSLTDYFPSRFELLVVRLHAHNLRPVGTAPSKHNAALTNRCRLNHSWDKSS